MSKKTNLEYLKKYRKSRVNFSVLIDRDLDERFKQYLATQGLSKSKWLISRINEELDKN